MAVARLQAILVCLPCGTAEAKDETYPNEKAALLSAATSNTRLTAETADNVVATLLTTSLAGPALQMQLDSVVGASGWRSNMAKYVLEKLTAALQASHERLGPTIRSAYHRAWEAAQSIEGFVIEHPVMCTVIALGVLAVVAPWILEALGFAELGPVQGTCIKMRLLSLLISNQDGVGREGTMVTEVRKMRSAEIWKKQLWREPNNHKLCTFANDFLIAETDATQCRYLRFLVAVGLRWPGTEALTVFLFPAFGHGELALDSGLRGNKAWLSSLRGSHLPGGPFRGDFQGSGEETRCRTAIEGADIAAG
ncbi:hypothetical protein IG631_21235 [Alternaria alternata]|nr:hypothetical protein IG631_21235 [Alternaria alternata]